VSESLLHINNIAGLGTYGWLFFRVGGGNFLIAYQGCSVIICHDVTQLETDRISFSFSSAEPSEWSVLVHFRFRPKLAPVYYKLKKVRSIFMFLAQTDRAFSFSVETKMSVSVAVSFRHQSQTSFE